MKFLIAILLFIGIFWLVGILFFNFREFDEENIKGFLIGMENSKTYSYYLNLPNGTVFCIKIDSWEIKECFKVDEGLIIKTDQKDEHPTIIIDNHAMGGMVHGSNNPKDLLFSEFIFGHVGLKNFNINDVIKAWK